MARRPIARFVVALLLSGCNGDPPDPPPPSSFAVDPVPSLVNSTPLTLSGTKGASTGVWLDDTLALTPDDETSWTLQAPLEAGDGAYQLSLREGTAGGPSGDAVWVQVTLDTVAPTVLSQLPAANAVDVSPGTMVQVVLSEPVSCDSAASAFGLYRQGSTPVAADLACADATLTLTPTTDLDFGTRYATILFADVVDRAGNPLAGAVSWQFDVVAAPDTTPPLPPTFDDPAPPGTPTLYARLPVGGDKEAGASVEFRWLLDAVQQQDWNEIAAVSGDTTWENVFELSVGANTIELRSFDAATNVSTVASFVITRDPFTGTVGTPTLDPVMTPTRAPTQVLAGGKPTGTSVWNGTQLLVPLNDEDRWDALVPLASGANHFDLVAKDFADNPSSAAPQQTITYAPWGPVTGGSLSIDLTLVDLWDQIGDEFNVADGSNDIDHFAVEAWAEGPLTFDDSGGPPVFETCFFDDTNLQRRHIRYAGTIVRTAYKTCLDVFPPEQCLGLWADPDYRNPNYLAALIEAGHWATANHPIPADVDRRTAIGWTWYTAVPPCDTHLWYDNGTPSCQTRMMQEPAIDGITEPTVVANFPANGLQLGTWSRNKVYTWDLRGADGQWIEKGAYLITVVVTVDREDAKAWVGDQETCWDRPAHDVVGSRRVEGIVVIDGTTAYDDFWVEKGHSETVQACQEPAGTNLVTCNCGGTTTFPCPSTPNGALGDPVLFLDGPARVIYTP